MNGWRGGSGADTGLGVAGAPMNVGAEVLPSGIGWAGTAADAAGAAMNATAAATTMPVESRRPCTTLLLRPASYPASPPRIPVPLPRLRRAVNLLWLDRPSEEWRRNGRDRRARDRQQRMGRGVRRGLGDGLELARA